MDIEILIASPMITLKSVAWGPKNKELYRSSQEAVRHAVQLHPESGQLRNWLESRTKLLLSVQFYMNARRANAADLDSLLSDLFNPLVEGACGPRPAGKPIPQTKDALFWEVHAKKVVDEDERTIVCIRPLDSTSV
jgi:hypothetical protein